MNRLFLADAAPGERSVEGPAAHHLVHVLRLRPGDEVEVFDGAGTSFPARVLRLEPSGAVLALGAGRAAAPLRPITIVQGLPKGDKLEWILQKGTELGASAFAVALCARTIVKVEGKEPQKLARWRRIAEEAARQCGRADVPTVYPALPLAAAVDALPPDTRLLVLDEAERAVALSTAVRSLGPQEPLALVVGPEGGLERGEVTALASRHAISVSLGSLILRTETAALAALSVVRHLDGALG